MGVNRDATTRFRDHIGAYARDSTRPLHLIYVPTHRDCRDVMHAVAQEVVASAAWSDHEFQLVVIDDRPLHLTHANEVAAREIARRLGVVVNWVDVRGWSQVVRMLSERSTEGESRAATERLLVKPTGSYAAGMNKAAILAAYLGATTLHRRDSDEYAVPSTSTGPGTLEVEVVALTSVPMPSGDRPYVVGSSVDGEPTKDHRDILAADASIGARLQRIGRRSRDAADQQDRPEAITMHLSSGDVIADRDVTGRTQVGVSASREVHFWIPEMPAVNVLGSDHFQKGLLYQMGFPVYWHPLAATHTYEAAREKQVDDGQLARYVISEMRHVVLRQYWNEANITLASLGGDLMREEGFDSTAYVQAFRQAVEASREQAQDAADQYLALYVEGAEVASGELARRLRVRADALAGENEVVVAYVETAISEFLELTSRWHGLIEGARRLGQGAPTAES